ncbi:MAG: hypothetical protein WEA77_14445 [Hyphomonas sp.]|uniref:hypothetical protein n=1 Tax=Hyphomonas sp. TaxID=87 RepID=UPI0034A01EEA
MRDFDAQLASRPHYLRGARTLAAIGLAVHRWLKAPITRADLANVTRSYDRLQARPAFAC